jgi:hypothetical protein
MMLRLESVALLAARPNPARQRVKVIAPTMTAMPPPNSPLPRDQWINEFIVELTRIRSRLTPKVAVTIAAHEWVRHQLIEPGRVARRYAAEQSIKDKNPQGDPG